MRAITVRPPWAQAIIWAGKTVENRSVISMWRRLAGERVAIHAGARVDDAAFADPVLRRARRDQGKLWEFLTRGAIIGTVTVTGVHWADDCGGCSPWAQGPWIGERRICHLTLTDPVPLAAPIAIRGKLGPWHLPAEVAATVRSDLASIGVSA